MIKARMPTAPLDSLDMIFKPEILAKIRRFAGSHFWTLRRIRDVSPAIFGAGT